MTNIKKYRLILKWIKQQIVLLITTHFGYKEHCVECKIRHKLLK